ncbi:MAG: hypothetical protein AABX49_00545 [Nanoarchaeota archaeon]
MSTFKERSSLLRKINACSELDLENGVLEEDDIYLQHMLADLVLLDKKRGEMQETLPNHVGLRNYDVIPEGVTKKDLYSWGLPRLIHNWRKLHSNETFDPGIGCITDEQRIKAYADVLYNYSRKRDKI